MKEILDLIRKEITDAFVACGYDEKYGRVSLSNRPDLCEYQCNGAMAAAKEYKKAPIAIATEVSEKLQDNPMFRLEIRDFPLIVGVDCHGGNLFAEAKNR